MGGVPLALGCWFSLAIAAPEGASPPAADARWSRLRHLNLHYDFPSYTSLQQWEERKAWLREHILVSTGLWPLPERTPLRAHIFGRIEREDYTIEKVYFESLPGFFVTGNLYRPKGKVGPFPAVLSPHGHWQEGRLAHTEAGSVPGRCITLARQGYVVFSYDMVGYNDSRQVPHRWGDERWALWGLSPMGLQLWNSLRGIDFLQSLPDVDPHRIACTGASGGGTQTFMAMAVDERIRVAAPVCMVSAFMQGGCVCENAPLLRIETFNVEIAALMAPRPLILVAATGDWTRHNLEEEGPAIQSIYRLYGAEDRFRCVRFEAGHNYNQQSREAVYAWFGKWFLGVDDPERFREAPFSVEKKEDLLVFPEGKGPSGVKNLEELAEVFRRLSEAQFRRARPRSLGDLPRFRATYGAGWRHALLAFFPPREPVRAFPMGEERRGGGVLRQWILSREGVEDRVPLWEYRPQGARPSGPAVLVVAAGGFPEVWEKEQPLLQSLGARGLRVFVVEVFRTGTAAAERPIPQDLQFFTTYNRTDTMERVQDILTALATLKAREDVTTLSLLGLGEGGLWALLARSLAPEAIARTAADFAHFRCRDDKEYLARCFVPLIRRLGDFRTALYLAAPRPLLLFNLGEEELPWLRDLYRAAGASARLRLFRARPPEETLVRWLAPPLSLRPPGAQGEEPLEP